MTYFQLDYFEHNTNPKTLFNRYRPRRKPKNPLAQQSQNISLSMQQQAKQSALQNSYNPFHPQLPPYFAAASHPLDQHYSVPYFSSFDHLALSKLSQSNNNHQMANANIAMSQSHQSQIDTHTTTAAKMAQSSPQSLVGSFYSGLYNNITSPAAALYSQMHSMNQNAVAGMYTPSSTSSASPGSSPSTGSQSALPDLDTSSLRRPVPVLY